MPTCGQMTRGKPAADAARVCVTFNKQPRIEAAGELIFFQPTVCLLVLLEPSLRLAGAAQTRGNLHRGDMDGRRWELSTMTRMEKWGRRGRACTPIDNVRRPVGGVKNQIRKVVADRKRTGKRGSVLDYSETSQPEVPGFVPGFVPIFQAPWQLGDEVHTYPRYLTMASPASWRACSFAGFEAGIDRKNAGGCIFASSLP